MMTKILIYAYCVGVFSSRRMEKRLGEDVGFRVLAAGNQPDFRTLSDFRKLHLKVLQELFDQVLQISLEAGKMKLGRVALDGSKVKANASKHKAMSYGRMEEDEKRLRAEVKRLLEQAEAADAEEDAGYGRDCVMKTRKRHAVRKMEVDPPEPSCRRGLQTAVSCCSQKLWW